MNAKFITLDEKQYELTFLRTEANPYDAEGSPVDLYTLNHNGRTLVAWIKEDGTIIHIGQDVNNPPLETTPENRLPVATLRERAIGIAEQYIPDFRERMKNLHPLEDHLRRNLYFFRYDDLSKLVAEEQIPPFAQVAVYGDGTFHSYSSTL